MGLMAQPELLATLAESIRSQKGLSDSGLQTSPAVQLVSQSVEIIVAPKADTSSPRRSAGMKKSATTFISHKIWPSQYSEVSPSRALKLSALSQHWVPIPPPRGESTLNARHSRSYRKATFLRCIPGPTYPKADPSEASQARRLTPQPLTR